MKRTLPVLVDVWQFECCGEPFAIGARVRWQLSLVTDLDKPGEALATVEGFVGEHAASENGPTGCLMEIGSATVLLRPSRPAGPVSATGVFVEDHHGLVPEELPPVDGRVSRIREVQAEYRWEGRFARPVSGTWQLHDIGSFFERSGTGPTTPGVPTVGTVNLLVHLDVDI